MTSATLDELHHPASDTSPTLAGGADAEARIAALRERIDEIDEVLIRLWQERATISHEVGSTRVAAGGTRLVLAREQEILTRYRDALGPDGAQLAVLILCAGRGPLTRRPAQPLPSGC